METVYLVVKAIFCKTMELEEIKRKLTGHTQLNDDGRGNGSCRAMSVECVLKLEDIIPVNEFPLQRGKKNNDATWVDGLTMTSPEGKKIVFKVEFDTGYPRYINHSDADRQRLLSIINEELESQHFVVICLDGEPFHQYVIYNRHPDSTIYDLITFYSGSDLKERLNVNLKTELERIQGGITPIYIYQKHNSEKK